MSAANTMTNNLIELVPLGIELLNVLATVAAVALIVAAAKMLIEHSKTMGAESGNNPRRAMMFVLSAVLLFNLGASTNTFLQTFYGEATTTQNLIGYTPSSNMTEEGSKMVKAMIYGLRLIGYFFFISGLLKLRNAGEQMAPGGQGAFQTSLWRIVGGVAAINIVATVNLISSFIGFGNVL